LTALAALGACAAPLSLQRHDVTPPGKVDLQAGVGGGVSTSILGISSDWALAVGECTTAEGGTVECATEESYRAGAETVFVSALLAPVQTHVDLAVRYGLVDGLDVGARWMPGLVRAEVASRARGAVLVLGYNHHFSVAGPLENLGIDGFSRQDYDIVVFWPIEASDWLRLTVGGRYMLSNWKLDLRPTVPLLPDGAEAVIEEAITDGLPHTKEVGSGRFIGAVFGAWATFDPVSIGAEMAVAHYAFSTVLLGEALDLSGLAFYPTVTGAVRF
jgi:hypothetical protein